ncbi:DUF1876 domain-containing protein [Streptomyces sp. NBC_00503]|nr:DUF1876 domain-containing protein [Streptomyces sp. NBC_00503]
MAEIGAELAAARAMEDLALQLKRAAYGDKETVGGDRDLDTRQVTGVRPTLGT